MSLPGSDAVTPSFATVRIMWAAYVAALVAVGVVGALVVDTGDGDGFAVVAAVSVAAFGVAGAVATVLLRRRPLDCGSDEALRQAWMRRCLVSLALAEAPALAGFGLSYPAGSLLPLGVGLAVAAVGMLRARPSHGAVARDDERLVARGCSRSLAGALGIGGPFGGPISG